ncbi:MAG: hypothetical protein HW416_3210 [Chloroflexi bacterium]|nr:hypothetical protein [Chloroflexota bacterium]
MGALRWDGAHLSLNGILVATLTLTGCGLPGPAAKGPEKAPTTAPSSEARTLVALVGQEPSSIAARPLTTGGTSLSFQQRLPNALLTVIDAQGSPRPELLENLPALNTSSWQVFPDGTMQTTYTLRPNLSWHDGQPLTADDFVFSWRVYSSPDLGQANQVPMTHIADVAAIDRQRFTINWKRSYPDAASLSYPNREVPALPQHILGPAFDGIATSGRESFVSNAYWTHEYVGLGPYRIERWQSGSFIDLVRFEGYALGAPKIGRVEMRFGQDANIAVVSLLSGAVHIVPSLDSSEVVREEWSRTNGGRFLDTLSSFIFVSFQLRPEYATLSASLDPLVRRAIAHMVDKQTLVDTIYGGQAVVTETPVWSGSQWGPAVDNSIPAYRHDLRASEGLMNQAGLSKGADGFYRGADGRLSPLEVVSTATPDKVQLSEVLADWFKAAGLDTSRRTIPSAQSQDNEVRSTYPGVLAVSGSGGDSALTNLGSAAIPGPNNRWVGSNRGGWSSAEYDRLLSAFNTTLDRGERVGQVRNMLRIASEELPVISLAFNVGKNAVVTELQGPGRAAPEANAAWNIHEWEFQ